MKFLTVIFFVSVGFAANAQADLTKDSLVKYRLEIDKIDSQIIQLLSARMDVVKKVGVVKKQNNMPIEQPGRWEELLKKLKQQAQSKGMDTVFVKDIYDRIHEESKRLQANLKK